ncbi:MAG: IPT/TIG domain-containing protein, partial [Candidatus Omnitrophota bacterium]|nr:IPT/TIG domain-containing protein [Candidatus Omnitrophota bacterium]
MLDLSAGAETKITSIDWCGAPMIHSDKIVWHDYRNFNADIYMYDISTGEETCITDYEGSQALPSIYGDKIVWRDARKGYSMPDIYMYDLSIGQERQITLPVASYRSAPSIYEDKIVYGESFRQGCVNANSAIYMYDLANEQEIQVVGFETNNWYPAVDKNYIVYSKMRDNTSDLYMSKFFLLPQVVSASPALASAGSVITIIGNGFGYEQGDSKVILGDGVICPAITWTDKEITCIAPEGVRAGLLKVITRGGDSNGILARVELSLNPVGNKAVRHSYPLSFSVSAAKLGAGTLTYFAHINDGMLPDINGDSKIDGKDIVAF